VTSLGRAAGGPVSDQRGVSLRVDRATLRFLDMDTLARFLVTAGFQIGLIRRLVARASIFLVRGRDLRLPQPVVSEPALEEAA
jgi:hypothetical protein